MSNTSEQALASVAGSAAQMRARVLAEIKRHPGGLTCDAVESNLDMRHQTASARVNELMTDGSIIDSGLQRPTRSGANAIVWVVSDERWLPVPGYEGWYDVSDKGRVRSWRIGGQAGKRRRSPSLRKLVPNQRGGYLNVMLTASDGILKLEYVHTLVLRAFVGEPLPGQEARHFPNNDVTDNSVKNLQWGTHLENVGDAIKLGTNTSGERNGRAKLTQQQADEIRRRLNKGEAGNDLAKEFGVAGSAISEIRYYLSYTGDGGPIAMCSPLKYLGGKHTLVPRLREMYAPHRHRRLVEPFVGGMNVALGLQPEHALLADANVHLINFYRRLSSPEPFTLVMENNEYLYYKYRDAFNYINEKFSVATATGAELFYYLNRTCFNGLCRFNASGQFNVPFGKYKTINYRRDFSEYASLLQRWELRYDSFDATLLYTTDDDFVYVDPPYEGTFVNYSEGGFTWGDQQHLAHRLGMLKCPVVASNAGTPPILDLYKGLGFKVETIESKRSIAANGDRANALEMLATKNL